MKMQKSVPQYPPLTIELPGWECETLRLELREAFAAGAIKRVALPILQEISEFLELNYPGW